MHTKDKLADALAGIGLTDMAAKARDGYYHDFLSPLPMPEIQLASDLAAKDTPEAWALRQRVVDGEFDASREEGEEWARSPEGRAAMRELGRGGKFLTGRTKP